METLGDKLSGPVDIRLILKINIDHGEGKGGKGTDIFHSRQSEHRGLDGIGNESLDFLGGHAFGVGVNLDKGRRRVGKNIDGKPLERKKPKNSDYCGG